MSNFNLIQDKLNLTSSNLSLISDNIANVNTPGFQRRFIDVQSSSFSSVLKSSPNKTNSKHITSFKDKYNGKIQEMDSYIRTDGNGVDIDKEVVEMNKNKLFYNSLITLLNGEINKYNTIITSK